MRALNRLGELNELTLMWAPKHHGAQSNKIAKQDTQENPVEQIVGILFAVCVDKKTHQGSSRSGAFYFLVREKRLPSGEAFDASTLAKQNC